jgi:type IV fimbrial biogenesis protein FimT
MSCRQQLLRGFTLIELIVVLSIAAIISTLAAPSFAEMIRNHRLTTKANDILSELYYARSEAIRRGAQVTIRSTSNIDSNWTSGWQVFADLDGDGQLDVGSDTLLRLREPLDGNYTLTSGNDYQTWMAYLPSGYPISSAGSGDDTFTLCAGNNINQARSISISNTGRASISDGVAACP